MFLGVFMEIDKIKELLFLVCGYEIFSTTVKNDEVEKNLHEFSAIASLIINDFFGGKIMECTTTLGSHYYNLIDNELIDLTIEHFLGEIPQYDEGQERTRSFLLINEDTRKRYELLVYNLKLLIRQVQGKKFKLIDINGEEYLSDIPGTLGGHKKLKLYGRLDCPSAKRWIDKGQYISNRVFFENEETAIAAGYRPCAICLPNEYKEWKKKKIKQLNNVKY